MMAILNAKIAQIRDFFLGQIHTITFHSDTLLQKVTLMESVNKGGVKFEDLDSERLIELLSQVEENVRERNFKQCRVDAGARTKDEMFRQKVLWDLLAKYFGPDYFLEVIEEEYGVAPGQNDQLDKQIKKHFRNDIDQFRREIIIKEKHFKDQLQQL